MKRSFSAIIATIIIAAVPVAASAQVSVGVGVGFGGPGWGVGIAAYSPPALPVYSMPPAPYPNWQWIPGYWGCGAYGYYWVPGYWTAPPAVGLYWTPGYWGYGNGGYAWNAGYWGPTVGFYGGINYGYGYFGAGFVGGYWSGGVFNYNTAVVNVNRTVIRNTYINRGVVRGRVISRSRVSFNGGRGGVRARPMAGQLAARRHAIAETAAQRAHERVAARDRDLLARVNHGHPRIAAVQRPFSATHRPAHMHAITGADRRDAQRQMHHMAAVAHRNATHHNTATHGRISASMHHSAALNTTHHSAPTTATRHYQLSAGATHNARPQVGYGHPSGAYSHGGRPPGGMAGGRPPGGMGGGHGGGRPARV
jgi:hypothetical protein